MTESLPTHADVERAAERLRGVALLTPLLANAALDRETGARVAVKAECLQRTGSFKLRGAFNRLSALDPEERGRGVVAFSSGNHAQGVAAAARQLGLSATIVMPSDAPRNKVEGVRSFGGEVVFFDRATEDREAIAAGIASERGAVVVPSYDDPFIIAGQGTVGLELVEQADPVLGAAPPDLLLCGASGGGLIAGIGLGISKRWDRTEVWAVEPEGFDDHRRSLAAGRRVRIDRVSGSICDSLLMPTPGRITFELNRSRLAGALAVTDDEVLKAMAFAFRHLKVVVEPGGAVALAALLSGRVDARGKSVVLVLTGGNVDPDLFRRALELA